MKCPECTDRIRRLRAWYEENAPIAVHGYWMSKTQRSLLLYMRGWMKNAEQPTFCMRKAASEQYLLEHLTPIIDPDELLVGQRDFTPFTEEEQAEFDDLERLYDKVIPPRRGRPDHMALDYEKLLRVGVDGLIDEIHSRIDGLGMLVGAELEKYEYYQCCLMELEGVRVLTRNYADAARKMAETAASPRKEELLDIAACLDRVPCGPAVTFRDALQSLHFFTFSLYGIYSFGRPDQFLYPYFRRDIDSGVLTMDEAQELIDCLCLHFMTGMPSWAAAGFEVGGLTRAGEPVENELTWMFLASIRHTRTADPNIGLCINSHTSPEILRFAAEMVADGLTHPAFWNDQGIIDSMIRNGYAPEDARWWTHSTCVEITPIGKSGVSITSPYVNTLKILLTALDKAGDDASFEDLIDLFHSEFRAVMQKEILNENLWQLERARNSTDPFRTSALTIGCLENGRSHDNGGAEYNFIEPNMLGMLNVTESLNVIYHLIYDEKRLTLSRFKQILAENYENDEPLRRHILNRIPHFGNNDDFSDNLARKIADIVLDVCGELRTYRGAAVIPGAFAYREYALQGRVTPASPDGRKAGQPLNAGSDPVSGYDTSGPTASLLSTVAWQPPRFLGGTAVNLKLNKNTPDLAQVIVTLVKAYVENGGSELQISVTDEQTLRDAQANPDAYRNLLVRIGGYSDYFVRIDKDMQEEVIRRTCM